MAREIINTEKAPAAIGPYVQAVADNGLLFISGQLGFDVEHGSVIPETVEEQATLSLKNLDAIMTAAGTDRTKVMKTTIFLTDMNDFAKVNEVYGAFFGEYYHIRRYRLYDSYHYGYGQLSGMAERS